MYIVRKSKSEIMTENKNLCKVPHGFWTIVYNIAMFQHCLCQKIQSFIYSNTVFIIIECLYFAKYVVYWWNKAKH